MTLVILVAVFQVKHFVADFLLQTRYQLGKFKADWGFFLPLLSHAGTQAAFTLAICLIVCPTLWWLALVDLVAHFVMDRVKAGPKYLGRFNDSKKAAYWIVIGFDQMFHGLTDLLIAYLLATGG
jgi:hypothetical protein